MPTKINFQNDGRPSLDPTVPVGAPMPTEGTDVATASLGPAVASIFGSVDQYRQNNALGAYSVEAADIIGSTANYSKERDRILRGLSSAQDQATVQQYYDKLQRLRNGEVQGALPPGSAAARMNNLTKSYINRYPALALKFRQVHNGIVDDIPQVAGSTGHEVDPDVEAMNSIIKSSGEKGISPAEEMTFRRTKSVADAQAEIFRARQQLGQSNLADLTSTVLTQANVFYADLMPRMAKASENPNFQGSNWFAQLSGAKAKIINDTNLMLQNVQKDGKFTLNNDDRKSIVEQATAPLDQLIEIAKSVDNPKTRASASQALRQITENGDFTNLRQSLGPAVSLFGSNAEATWSYITDLSKVAERYSKGQGKLLEAQAQYDPKTKMMLDALKQNGGWEGLLASSAKQVSDKSPRVSTGNEVYDKLNLQGGIDYAIRPTMARFPKDQGEGLAYLAGDPNAFEAWDNRSDLVNISKNYPEVLDALRQNSTRLLMEQAHQAGTVDMENIRKNILNPQTPFTVDKLTSAAPGTGGVPGGIYGDKLQYSNPHTRDLVDKLNQQYRVFVKMGMSRAEAQKWASTTMDDLLGANAPNFLDNKATPQVDTNTVTVSNADAALEAEAKQAGMSVADYKKWINTPAN